jgi:hypothetical protein
VGLPTIGTKKVDVPTVKIGSRKMAL